MGSLKFTNRAPLPVSEADVMHAVGLAWGSHPRLRIARINTGVGWFNASGPCRRTDRGARPVYFNPRGTADYCGVLAPTGRLVMIECKRPVGGAQSDDQKSMQRMVESFGGIYILARCLADVDARMAAEGVTR